MQLVLSDAQYWGNFLPLTYTKPVAEMRCGILTFAERWQKLLSIDEITYITEDYLQTKFPKPLGKTSLFLVPNFIPSNDVLEKIRNLKFGEALVYEDEVLVAHLNIENFSLNQIEKMTDIVEDILFFKNASDLFSQNEKAINYDFDLLTKGRTSQPLSETNGFLGDKNDLFIEEGAEIEFSTLNCKTGKIYIGKNAEVMEGCHLRGPITLGENSKFNLGAKIYGATTIGPSCKIGGEVNNIVVFGFSNKGHDGFVGNSVIGEWCNLGADTNSSNLKNNYADVKIWNYNDNKFINSGLQFFGMLMGDHAKTAINTQINTGTVIGVAANIFKGGFPPNVVPNFSWGGRKEDEKFNLEKVYEVAGKVMQRRKVTLSEEDKEILKFVHSNY